MRARSSRLRSPRSRSAGRIAGTPRSVRTTFPRFSPPAQREKRLRGSMERVQSIRSLEADSFERLVAREKPSQAEEIEPAEIERAIDDPVASVRERGEPFARARFELPFTASSGRRTDLARSLEVASNTERPRVASVPGSVEPARDGGRDSIETAALVMGFDDRPQCQRRVRARLSLVEHRGEFAFGKLERAEVEERQPTNDASIVRKPRFCVPRERCRGQTRGFRDVSTPIGLERVTHLLRRRGARPGSGKPRRRSTSYTRFRPSASSLEGADLSELAADVSATPSIRKRKISPDKSAVKAEEPQAKRKAREDARAAELGSSSPRSACRSRTARTTQSRPIPETPTARSPRFFSSGRTPSRGFSKRIRRSPRSRRVPATPSGACKRSGR